MQFRSAAVCDHATAITTALAASEKAISAALVANEKLVNASEKATSAALTAAKEAVVKAEAASDKRFDSVTEFRAQLKDQAATFITRDEYTLQLRAVLDKIDLPILMAKLTERQLR